MESYLKYNYVPLEDQVTEAFHRREQVSRTLEYAYDDFVLAQVAKKLGKTDDYKALIKRAENYRNVIDPETGYARGRHADGTWIEPFDPFASTSFICEGTPYHYTWYAPQDIAGLIRHMGGKERFINRLDNFFEGNYYWHGNEPGHHIAYLFAYAGEPWKTQNGYMISSTASISRLPTDYPATTMPARCHPGWSSAWSASIRSVRACPTT